MSAELNKLRYRIRERKKVLRANIKIVRRFVKKTRLKQFRYFAGRASMTEDEQLLLPAMERRLDELRLALATMNDLTREAYEPQRRALKLTKAIQQKRLPESATGNKVIAQ